MLQCYNVTLLQYFDVTMIQCYSVTMLQCYSVTMLRSISFIRVLLFFEHAKTHVEPTDRPTDNLNNYLKNMSN